MMSESGLAATFLLRLFFRLVLGLKLAEVILQPVEPLLPELTIALQPVVDAFQRLRLELAGPPLRLAAARDQAGGFQHLEMLGDRRAADVERLGELRHRGFAKREPRQDGPAGRI